MSNTNIDLLYPEFWAASFDALNMGEYQLQNLVSRQYESQIGQAGDQVNVPIAVDFGDADSWTPGDAISGTAITQTTAPVILDKSFKKGINLNGRELSLSPYNLIDSYGVGLAKSMVRQVNLEIYKEALKSTYWVDATGGISEDLVVSAGTKLSENEVGMVGRNFVASPGVMGALMKVDAFQHVDTTGTADVMANGLINRRMGFDFYSNNAIAKYTPADLLGAIDGDVAAGVSTMDVTGLDDDATPIRAGDIFTVAGDSTKYTVTATTVDTGADTVSLTFSPALVANPASSAVITFVGTQSALAFVPSAVALAARPYASLPDGAGVRSTVVNAMGLPIRISVWHDAKLGVQVQYDVLFGVKLIDAKRMVRLVEDI
jgi:hypothetical protein